MQMRNLVRCRACAKSLANANISRLCCDVITINRLKPEGALALSRFNQTEFPGDYCEWEPPDPFPNSEVKTLSADGSVAVGHVRVGRRQGPNPKPRSALLDGALSFSVGISPNFSGFSRLRFRG